MRSSEGRFDHTSRPNESQVEQLAEEVRRGGHLSSLFDGPSDYSRESEWDICFGDPQGECVTQFIKGENEFLTQVRESDLEPGLTREYLLEAFYLLHQLARKFDAWRQLPEHSSPRPTPESQVRQFAEVLWQ